MKAGILDVIAGVAELLTKLAGLLSPKIREKVRRLKAIHYAEQFILYFDKLDKVVNFIPNDGKPRRKNEIIHKMKQYRRAFFNYN